MTYFQIVSDNYILKYHKFTFFLEYNFHLSSTFIKY